MEITVRNTGDIVEEYHLQATGDPGRWCAIEPQTLRLYPGTTGTAIATFAPPRSPEAQAGPQSYSIKVTPREDRENTFAIEGVLRVAEFADLRAELLPPTTRGWHRGRVRLAVDNYSNTVASAAVSTTSTNSNLAGRHPHPRATATARTRHLQQVQRPPRPVAVVRHQSPAPVQPHHHPLRPGPADQPARHLPPVGAPTALASTTSDALRCRSRRDPRPLVRHPPLLRHHRANLPTPRGRDRPDRRRHPAHTGRPAQPARRRSPPRRPPQPPPPATTSTSAPPAPHTTTKARPRPRHPHPNPPRPRRRRPRRRPTSSTTQANASVDLNQDKFNDGQLVDIWPTNHSPAQTWTVWQYADGSPGDPVQRQARQAPA